MKLYWLPRAIGDRNAQLAHIAADNPVAAIRQGDEIQKQADALGEYPKMGREGRRQGTRELVINRTPFILVYRIKLQRIEILRILHGRQQWP